MEKHGEIIFKKAASAEEFADAKVLFEQYAASLDIDLCFQGFADEVKTVSIQYNMPQGALLLAYVNEKAVGCAAIRRLDDDSAELKRMFVQPEYRQYKLGRKLLELAIAVTGELNYKNIKLDTLPTMLPALNLYRSVGFYEIPAYRFNPVAGAVYMEKKLGTDQ
ncbi:MAG: GNAT family N-acetyltransferase [Ferruginibacter sp.]